MMKVRKRYVFYGRVQGVGFRYHAQYGARARGLTGWVRNEYDGTVIMEVQGLTGDIEQLIRILKEARFIEIDRMEVKECPLEEEERGFHVRGY